MKQRLDVFLLEQGYAPSREKARSLIVEGQVYLNGQRVRKAGAPVQPEDKLEVRGEGLRYVSRGGLKLEKALRVFPIRLQGAVCMDIGASTGGFTDCMLQNGASRVYAIDVGTQQLAQELRNDKRVINLENTNFRYVTKEQVPEPVDFASVDVSFISLKLILPVAYGLLRENGEMVCLIKPQFEAGRDKIGKKGVVKDPQIHQTVLEMIVSFAQAQGFAAAGLEYSPIKGPQGNIEYLMYLKKLREAAETEVSALGIAELVQRSHTLDRE